MSNTPPLDAIPTVPTAQLFPLGRFVLDLFLTAIFGGLMAFVLRPHVPSDEPFWINVWSGLTAACLAGVFFMALQMFRLVVHDKGESE